MPYSSSKMSSTKGNISKLSSLLLSGLRQISSLKFRFTFWKASLLLLPGLFSARNRSYVQTVCSWARGRGGNVSRRLCKDYLHQVWSDRLSPTAIPWLQRSVKCKVPSILWFVWKISDFLVTQEQKLGARGHRALLEHSPDHTSGSARWGSGIPVYPKKIRQNTQK